MRLEGQNRAQIALGVARPETLTVAGWCTALLLERASYTIFICVLARSFHHPLTETRALPAC